MTLTLINHIPSFSISVLFIYHFSGLRLQQFSNIQGQLNPQSRVDPAKIDLIQDVLVILVTSKNEENSIKIEGAKVPTTLNIDFSDTQGQLTPQS